MAQNIYTTQFATRAEVTSEISQTAQDITLSVDKKLENYSTTTEMNSAIQITANGINQTVSQKVGKDEVVSNINQSAEEIKITGNRFIVDSNNFKLDKNGNMTCNDATLRNASFVNGAINITQEDGETTLPILLNQTKNGNDYNCRLGSGGMQFLQNGQNMARIGGGATNGGTLYLYNQSGINTVFLDGHHNGHGLIQMYNSSGTLNIALSSQTGNIKCVTLTQTSLEETKKNFEKLENALDIVKNTDIYKYNFKTEENGEKKHIGAVIGRKYNYSKEITGLDETGKEVGIDTYSMVSVLWKALQEQQEKIEELETKIKGE
jgi:hypothetical protein